MIERILQRLVTQAIDKSQTLSRPLRSTPTRTFRLHPATRLIRPYSTSNGTQTIPLEKPRNTHEETLSTPTESSKKVPPKRKLPIRRYILATVCFLVGAGAGKYISLIIAPPPNPVPGTPEDERLIEYIHKLASRLSIVQSLSSDSAWLSWDAYSTFTPKEKAHRLTTSALAGARGIGGYQRIFHNPETDEFVSVVWIGGAMAGWPGVAHGGLIATLLDESLSRCAIARFPAKTGVTANLELKYLAPTVTNGFVVIRVAPILESSTDRKGFVAGRLETLEGKVCVEAKGLFVVPKRIKLDQLKQIQLQDLTKGF